jgi:serine protease Do
MTNREQVVETLREFRAGQTVKLRAQRADEQLEREVVMMSIGPSQSSARFDPQQRIRRLGGEISQRSEGFEQAIEHDTVLQPWLCGGPLVDLDGKGIGLNIARAGRVTTYALSSTVVQKVFENLRAAAAGANNTGK